MILRQRYGIPDWLDSETELLLLRTGTIDELLRTGTIDELLDNEMNELDGSLELLYTESEDPATLLIDGNGPRGLAHAARPRRIVPRLGSAAVHFFHSAARGPTTPATNACRPTCVVDSITRHALCS